MTEGNGEREDGAEGDDGVSARGAVLGCLGGLLFLLVPVGLYLATAWMFGFLPHPALGPWYYAGGAVLALVVTLAVTIMGESLIEDAVKFTMFAVSFLALWSLTGPEITAVALGAPIGAAMPLIMRLLPGGR